uniref:Uncharacterized protein n=1 Tax=Glossina palpalis gambiensis TaxID=67801 RepID=A0A1B0B0C6_9MUSC
MQRKHSHSHSPHPSRHTSPHSRHTSPHSKHTSNHSRHNSPHSRHASPYSRHTSPHSRHTSPHSRRTSPHRGSGHSHHHHIVHDQQLPIAETLTRNLPLRSSVRSTSSHTHSHHHSHHYRNRKRIQNLYGTTSRRPSSCCTSSDYCYQTDSTSLYGSRSSLSRNNSIKSANVTFRQKKLNKRQPSYSSLRAINTSRPNSQIGSLTSVFDRSRIYEDDNYITNGDRSKSEHQTSKDALNNELPEYACSPSPIRWSFLADSKSPTDTLEGKTTTNTSTSTGAQKTKEKEHVNAEHHEKSASGRYHRTQRTQSCVRGDENPSTSRKCCESPKPYETSTTVQFHQEGESYNNCCNNYIQCNTYLDQDLQITSEDIHQYLSKGNQEAGSVLNNAKTYPFQPSNALEFQYKNNFANNNNNAASNTLSSMEGAESLRSYDSRFRRNSSKETNLNQNVTTTETCVGACAVSSCSSGTPLSPTNINLSSSTNNINIVFSSCLERNANEVKFINTAVGEVRERENGLRDTHHGGNYLPFAYPAYDYTNMSASSIFDKPLGIDELPKEFNSATETTGNTSSSQHSSSLQSPEPNRVSFESFDAASEHNLLSRQGSCQYSSTPRTPRSPDSIANSSTYSAAILRILDVNTWWWLLKSKAKVWISSNLFSNRNLFIQSSTQQEKMESNKT